MKTTPYRLKKFRKFRRNQRIGGVIAIILILILCYLSLSLFQSSRYDYDNYHCMHMSRDVAPFFEAIGIKTYYVRGIRGCAEKGIEAHMWLMLDLPLIGMTEFEATNLMFQKNSDCYRIYDISRTYDFSYL